MRPRVGRGVGCARALRTAPRSDLAAQGMNVRVGMGPGGHARWFERLLAELLLERYRDRATTTWNLLDFNGTDCPFLIL